MPPNELRHRVMLIAQEVVEHRSNTGILRWTGVTRHPETEPPRSKVRADLISQLIPLALPLGLHVSTR